MPEFFCNKVKTATGYALVPAHGSDLETMKKLAKSQPLRCKVTQVRNVDHHRKYFALLNYAFECWDEPTLSHADMMKACKFEITPEMVKKNFERFRKDIAILSGFYDPTYRINGELIMEPKSISFSAMSQEVFEMLYDATIDVIVQHVLRNYDGDELRAVVDQVMEFDS